MNASEKWESLAGNNQMSISLPSAIKSTKSKGYIWSDSNVNEVNPWYPHFVLWIVETKCSQTSRFSFYFFLFEEIIGLRANFLNSDTNLFKTIS